jgi:translation initiation factor IF-2
VEEGKMYKGESFRIDRRGSIIGEGKIKELQQKKSPVEEVAEGQEFGALVESRMDISAGDTLEFFKTVSKSIEI